MKRAKPNFRILGLTSLGILGLVGVISFQNFDSVNMRGRSIAQRAPAAEPFADGASTAIASAAGESTISSGPSFLKASDLGLRDDFMDPFQATLPLYRSWNPRTGLHMTTPDRFEGNFNLDGRIARIYQLHSNHPYRNDPSRPTVMVHRCITLEGGHILKRDRYGVGLKSSCSGISPIAIPDRTLGRISLFQGPGEVPLYQCTQSRGRLRNGLPVTDYMDTTDPQECASTQYGKSYAPHPQILGYVLPANAYRQIVSFQAMNGQYLAAENGGGQHLIANRGSPGAWESFEVTDEFSMSTQFTNGNDQIRHGMVISMKGHNGCIVSAENGGSLSPNLENVSVHPKKYIPANKAAGIIVCNRSAVASWELFRLVKLNSQGSRPAQMGDMIFDGDRIAIQAQNGRYLSARNGGGSLVFGNRAQIGPWETFVIRHRRK